MCCDDGLLARHCNDMGDVMFVYMRGERYHFNTRSSSKQDPVQAVLTSNRPLSTHDVGPGAVGHPDAESQHNTLPGAMVVVEFTTWIVGVAKAHVELAVHPHGWARFRALRKV